MNPFAAGMTISSKREVQASGLIPRDEESACCCGRGPSKATSLADLLLGFKHLVPPSPSSGLRGDAQDLLKYE